MALNCPAAQPNNSLNPTLASPQVNDILHAKSNNSFKLTGDCILVMVIWMAFGVDLRQLNSGVRLLLNENDSHSKLVA
jgi:hypothetical protein